MSDPNATYSDSPYLVLSTEELVSRNIALKREREAGATSEEFSKKLVPVLREESGIRAVTVCFSNLEGRLHLLDYAKDFFLDSLDNLTFDGSSIKGFTPQNQSDLRLYPDWTSFRWLPASIFGPGKVMIFARVANQDGSDYESDMRARLSSLLKQLKSEKNMMVWTAPETEGFLLKGVHAEQNFTDEKPFEVATTSAYFSSLPQGSLREYIDTFAKTLHLLGFENEKDHPEVAPAQFELNYRYTDALAAADQILLYKLTARQIAKNKGLTASFLPKPFAGLNGSGMHTNMSLSQNGKNIFYDGSDADNLSKAGRSFAAGILNHGKEIALSLIPSVNGFRRLDPNYEAPNQIMISAKDRGSMIRVPVGNERSARIEVRIVCPDANPYLALYTLIKAGLEGLEEESAFSNSGEPELLPINIQEALDHFRASDFMRDILGRSVLNKYADLKQAVADRSPRDFGTRVKKGEVAYHHEVYNQDTWSDF